MHERALTHGCRTPDVCIWVCVHVGMFMTTYLELLSGNMWVCDGVCEGGRQLDVEDTLYLI